MEVLSSVDETEQQLTRDLSSELHGGAGNLETEESDSEEIIDMTTPDNNKRKSAKAKTPAKKQKNSKTTKVSTRPEVEQMEVESTEEFDSDDMWTLWESIWPLADRPAGKLHNRAWVNSQRYEVLHMMRKDFKEAKKEEEGQSDTKYRADTLPPMRTFKAGKDDRMTIFHPASYLRRPVAAEKVMWKDVPHKLDHVYRGIDLSIYGAESQVAERTVAICHDRTKPLELKMFHRFNATVAYQPMVEERRKSQDNRVSTITDFDWQNLNSMTHVQDAILNFAIVTQNLWPWDHTGLSILKLYNLYQGNHNLITLSTIRITSYLLLWGNCSIMG